MRGKVSRRPSRQVMLASTSSKVATLSSSSSTTVEKEEEEKFQTVVLGLIARYSRYSWLTWIVVKIILKVTTYTVLKVTTFDFRMVNRKKEITNDKNQEKENLNNSQSFV